MPPEPNKLIRELGGICRGHLLAEKWGVAPSLRVGYQWLDSVARSGQPVLNARVKTVQTLALELAASAMGRLGAAFLTGIQREVVVARLLQRLRQSGAGYLSGLAPSRGLTETLVRTLRDIRLAGLAASDLDPESFEAEAKGREIKGLLSAYERELKDRRLADDAEVLRLARRELEAGSAVLPEGALVILPRDAVDGLSFLERALWEALPEQSRRVLQVDGPADPPDGNSTDLASLRRVLDPAGTPPPRGDGTAAVFRAIGETNEVREVLRRCLAESIPFDDVEILHTDADTYVPLIYEIAGILDTDEQGAVPVTFAEGLPVRYSRPGRALLGWLSWIRDGYPQSTLARMIQDGLLAAQRIDEEAMAFPRLAAVFRSVPIGGGRDRYLGCLDDTIAGLEARSARRRTDEDGEQRSTWQPEAVSQRMDALNILRDLVVRLLSLAVGRARSQRGILEGAAIFLQRHVRCVSELDEYSRQRLSREIADLCGCLDDGDVEGLDLLAWLADLPHTVSVQGQGPRPGCLYVAPLAGGGHSGRRHTFIVGLDDGRHPGALRQEPIMLDRERTGISRELPTAAGSLAERILGLARLMARLRGQVTLSYSCRDVVEDRETFPSPVIWSAYRILSGNHVGAYEELLSWLPQPVSFAPGSAERCLHAAEWWLWRTCGDERSRVPESVVSEHFPHLGRGLVARDARQSDRFTEYDGCVPEAGSDLDPGRPDSPAVSAGQLETLGSCPMEYFLRYVLRIEPPEKHGLDPGVWLDPGERGSLLHAVFKDFMHRLQGEGTLPDFGRHEGLIQGILAQHIERWRDERPPPGRDVFQREVDELRRTAHVFLREEEAFCRTSRPLCLEASIGLPSDDGGTAFDTADPVALVLPDGSTIRARGRIDRVDRTLGAEGGLAVWDYKTGSARRYRQADPFGQGRRVQNVLYLLLAAARAKEVCADSVVTAFGYFFPSTSAYGERISWTAEQLRRGEQVLLSLRRMIAAGCFPLSDDPGDASRSDYRIAFGDVEAAADAVSRKLANTENQALEPFRELRGRE